MREEIAQICGACDAAAFDGFVDWLRRLYDVELPQLHRPQLRLPARAVASPAGAFARLLRLGAFGRLVAAVAAASDDPRLHRLFSFQAMYAGLAPDEALALYAVITYMDSIDGVWFPEGGMHAVPVAHGRSPRRRPARRSATATRSTAILRSPRRARWPASGSAPASSFAADAVVCTLDLPVAYGTLLPGPAPPRVAGAAAYSPSAVVWHVGVRGACPSRSRSPQHPLRGASGTAAFDGLLDARAADAGPVAAGHRAVAGRSDARPAGLLDALRAGAGAEPRRAGRLGDARPARCGNGCTDSSPEHGYPSDVVTEELVTPLDWRGAGHGARDPVRAGPHVRPDRPVPAANVERRLPGLFFAGSGTVPGVGVPMVLISGQARRRAGWRRYLRGVGRRVSTSARASLAAEGYRHCAQLTRRYGTTYFWGAALLPRAPAQARPCGLRPLPAGRRHRRHLPDPGGTSAGRRRGAARRLRADRFRIALVDRRQRRPGAGRGRHTP